MAENSGESMVELGAKWDCWSCSTKFYDLGRDPVVCPKCGADQAKENEPPEPEEENDKKK